MSRESRDRDHKLQDRLYKAIMRHEKETEDRKAKLTLEEDLILINNVARWCLHPDKTKFISVFGLPQRTAMSTLSVELTLNFLMLIKTYNHRQIYSDKHYKYVIFCNIFIYTS